MRAASTSSSSPWRCIIRRAKNLSVTVRERQSVAIVGSADDEKGLLRGATAGPWTRQLGKLVRLPPDDLTVAPYGMLLRQSCEHPGVYERRNAFSQRQQAVAPREGGSRETREYADAVPTGTIARSNVRLTP